MTFRFTLADALRSPLTSKADLAAIDREALVADRPKIAKAARAEIERREDEPEIGDGCLACGQLECDCDRRYDEARERDD